MSTLHEIKRYAAGQRISITAAAMVTAAGGKKWIQEVAKKMDEKGTKGALHRYLGIPENETIPKALLEKTLKDPKISETTRKRVTFALNIAKVGKHVKSQKATAALGDADTTKVAYRRVKSDNEIIAVFPEQVGRNGKVMIFTLDDAHAEVTVAWVRGSTVPAKPEEYQKLQAAVARRYAKQVVVPTTVLFQLLKAKPVTASNPALDKTQQLGNVYARTRRFARDYPSAEHTADFKKARAELLKHLGPDRFARWEKQCDSMDASRGKKITANANIWVLKSDKGQKQGTDPKAVIDAFVKEFGSRGSKFRLSENKHEGTNLVFTPGCRLFKGTIKEIQEQLNAVL